MSKASKGAADVAMCLTDISPGARWRGTFLQEVPWDTPPNYVQLFGFDLLMLVPDLLHCVNLGIGRDLAGCVLKVILRDQQVFQGENVNLRLQRATDSLKAYARQHGHILRMKKLSKKKITWETKKYPELKASGSDTHVVCAWLEQLLEPFRDTHGDFCCMLWSLNRCLRLLYAADWFLTDAEKDTVETLGGIFTSTFLRMAAAAVQNNELMFRVRPKLHMFLHMTEWPRRVNVSRYSCWMDEDWLKKISKTMKLTSVKTAQKRVLQRWLMAVPGNLNKMIPKTS